MVCLGLFPPTALLLADARAVGVAVVRSHEGITHW
jgi:hypothetical protein